MGREGEKGVGGGRGREEGGGRGGGKRLGRMEGEKGLRRRKRRGWCQNGI